MGLTMRLASLSAGPLRNPSDVAARQVDKPLQFSKGKSLRCRFSLLIARRLIIHRLH